MYMVWKLTQTRRLSIFLLVSMAIASVALSGAVAAQPAVQTDTVDVEGSEVVIDTQNIEVVGIAPPDEYEATDISDDGLAQLGGAFWESPPETVSFVLTPPDSASAGDTVDLIVASSESDTESHTLTVVDGSADNGVPNDGPVEQDTVQIDGSEISFAVADGAAAAAVENFDPEDVELELGDDADPQPDGAIWNSPDTNTVSFTLTPAAHQDVGDTISFDVYDGDNTETVTVEIVDLSPVPDNFVGTPEQFRAIDTGGDGELGSIEIAQAITQNAEEGSVDGVEISPIEFAQIIDWNSQQ